jgi:DNA modification methylase
MQRSVLLRVPQERGAAEVLLERLPVPRPLPPRDARGACSDDGHRMTLALRQMHVGDCRELLRQVDDESINCVVTSPPYFQLRDYGVEGQIGLEQTPEAYVAVLVDVFREVRRVLREDGTLWLNLGDSFAQGNRGGIGDASTLEGSRHNQNESRAAKARASFRRDGAAVAATAHRKISGLKPKDMIGIPWMVAFALRADGWFLRSDIIWHKLQAMPESVRDRPTKAHEYLFLLSKRERYYYDWKAIREPVTGGAHHRGGGINPKILGGDHPRNVDSRYQAPGQPEHSGLRRRGLEVVRARKNERSGEAMAPEDARRKVGFNDRWRVKQNASFAAATSELVDARNKRSVWSLGCEPFSGAHFATFPRKLVEPCILAGCPAGGVVLDPFGGSGTVGEVAEALGRNYLLFDLNSEYAELARQRTAQRGLFVETLARELPDRPTDRPTDRPLSRISMARSQQVLSRRGTTRRRPLFPAQARRAAIHATRRDAGAPGARRTVRVRVVAPAPALRHPRHEWARRLDVQHLSPHRWPSSLGRDPGSRASAGGRGSRLRTGRTADLRLGRQGRQFEPGLLLQASGLSRRGSTALLRAHEAPISGRAQNAAPQAVGAGRNGSERKGG